MNILPTVVTFLMVLVLISYARLDSFRALWVTRKEFEKYMQKEERFLANTLSEEKYNITLAKSGGKNSKDPNPKAEGSPRISWHLFVEREKPGQDMNAFKMEHDVTIRLIHVIFDGHSKEFDEILLANPHILEELLSRIRSAALVQSDKLNITKASDLSNLELGDPKFNHLLYLLFEGYSLSDKSYSKENKDENEDDKGSDDAELETQMQTDAGEFRSETGRISLLDYITINNTDKIRVFLAPTPVLMAIFGDINIVNQIVETRIALYKEVRSSKKDKQAATAAFQEAFKSAAPIEYQNYLNFQVTKVDPRDYH